MLRKLISIYVASFILYLGTAFATQSESLSRAQLESLLKRENYAIISAGRNMNDPADVLLSDRHILLRTRELYKKLLQAGFRPEKAVGKYGVKEDAFLVPGTLKKERFFLKTGASFKQESIILASGGSQKMVYTTGKNKGMSYTGKGYTLPDASQTDYYTEVMTADGSLFRFSLNFNFEISCENQIGSYETCLRQAK